MVYIYYGFYYFGFKTIKPFNAYENIRSLFSILAFQTLELIVMGASLKHCHAHRICAIKSEYLFFQNIN